MRTWIEGTTNAYTHNAARLTAVRPHDRPPHPHPHHRPRHRTHPPPPHPPRPPPPPPAPPPRRPPPPTPPPHPPPPHPPPPPPPPPPHARRRLHPRSLLRSGLRPRVNSHYAHRRRYQVPGTLLLLDLYWRPRPHRPGRLHHLAVLTCHP